KIFFLPCVSQAGLLKENILGRGKGQEGNVTTNLAELSIYLLLRVQSSSIFNQSSSVKMYFRDFMQRELFAIKSSHTHTHAKIFDL
ncbi:hypothetical protein Z169_10157, partial [Egretta garzetta]